MSLDSFFKITERGSTVATEIRAGVSSFLTLSYLLLVNPQVLAKAGMDSNDVSTSTCLCCCIPTILVGLAGNLPYVMAPGLGLSAFLTYGLVNRKDGTEMTWENSLACVFLAGAVMLILTVTYLVQVSMALVPGHIKLGTIIGIGFLLATIGFESAGIIQNGELADMMAPDAWPMWVALGGLVLIGTMFHYNLPGAILIGVVVAAVTIWTGKHSWPTQIVELPDLSSTFLKMDIMTLDWRTAVPATMTFLLVALFDCSGCLIGLSVKAGLITNVSDKVPGGMWPLIASALGTMMAGLTGCSPIILAVECTAGILDGGRTGLTAVTAGALFGMSLFFAPLFGAVPEVASAPVLILIGSMMMREVGQIQWEETKVALPAFLTISMMPLSHSISNGVWFGLGTCIMLELFTSDKYKACCGAGDEESAPFDHKPFSVMEPAAAHSGPFRASSDRQRVHTNGAALPSTGSLSNSFRANGAGEGQYDLRRPLMGGGDYDD